MKEKHVLTLAPKASFQDRLQYKKKRRRDSYTSVLTTYNFPFNLLVPLSIVRTFKSTTEKGGLGKEYQTNTQPSRHSLLTLLFPHIRMDHRGLSGREWWQGSRSQASISASEKHQGSGGGVGAERVSEVEDRSLPSQPRLIFMSRWAGRRVSDVFATCWKRNFFYQCKRKWLKSETEKS